MRNRHLSIGLGPEIRDSPLIDESGKASTHTRPPSERATEANTLFSSASNCFYTVLVGI